MIGIGIIDIIMIGLWCFTCMITLYSWFQLVNSPTLVIQHGNVNCSFFEDFPSELNLHLVRGFPSHVSLPEAISCYFTSGTSGSVPAFCFPTWAPYVHIYLRSTHLKRLNPNFWTRKSPMVVAWHPIWCYLNPTFLGSFVSTIHISYSKMCTLWTLEHIHLGKLYPWLGKLLFIKPGFDENIPEMISNINTHWDMFDTHWVYQTWLENLPMIRFGDPRNLRCSPRWCGVHCPLLWRRVVATLKDGETSRPLLEPQKRWKRFEFATILVGFCFSILLEAAINMGWS